MNRGLHQPTERFSIHRSFPLILILIQFDSCELNEYSQAVPELKIWHNDNHPYSKRKKIDWHTSVSFNLFLSGPATLWIHRIQIVQPIIRNFTWNNWVKRWIGSAFIWHLSILSATRILVWNPHRVRNEITKYSFPCSVNCQIFYNVSDKAKLSRAQDPMTDCHEFHYIFLTKHCEIVAAYTCSNCYFYSFLFYLSVSKSVE